MSDNVLQTLQTAIQDVIAPDVRELKVKVAAHQEQTKLQYETLHEQIAAVSEKFDAQYRTASEKSDTQHRTVQEQMRLQYEALREQIVAASEKSDAQFKAVLAAFGQNKAEAELATMRTIAALSERVAVLEATRH